MTNRIIKDFKGWNLLTETSDIVGATPVPSTSVLNSQTPNLSFNQSPSAYVAGDLAKSIDPNSQASRVIAAGIAAQTAAATSGTAGTAAAAKVKAAPPIPPSDLKTANAAALTPNDWAAIQTKLNAVASAASAADNAAAVLRMQRPPDQKEEPAVLPPYANFGTAITKENKTRSFTKLYESLVPDGLVGPLTLAAVADFVTKYNATPAGTATPLPTTPPTATTIDQSVLAAITAAAAPATSTTDTTTVAPTDSTTPAGKMTLAAAKAAVVIMQKIRTAADGPGTDEELLTTSITTPTTADDFYNLNTMLKKEYGMTVAEVINDEFGTDDLTYVTRIKTYLDGLKIESSFTKARPSMNYEGTPETDFKEGSFKITIPTGKEPDTLYPAITNRNELYS
jgi:hypothetical protein